MNNTTKFKIGQSVKCLAGATRKEGKVYIVIDIIHEGGFIKYELNDGGGIQREKDLIEEIPDYDPLEYID